MAAAKDFLRRSNSENLIQHNLPFLPQSLSFETVSLGSILTHSWLSSWQYLKWSKPKVTATPTIDCILYWVAWGVKTPLIWASQSEGSLDKGRKNEAFALCLLTLTRKFIVSLVLVLTSSGFQNTLKSSLASQPCKPNRYHILGFIGRWPVYSYSDHGLLATLINPLYNCMDLFMLWTVLTSSLSPG